MKTKTNKPRAKELVVLFYGFDCHNRTDSGNTVSTQQAKKGIRSEILPYMSIELSWHQSYWTYLSTTEAREAERPTKNYFLLGFSHRREVTFIFFQRNLIIEKWDSLQYFQCIETTQYFHNCYSLFRLLTIPREVWWRGLQCVLGKSKTSGYFSKVTQMVPGGLTETWSLVPRVLFLSLKSRAVTQIQKATERGQVEICCDIIWLESS